MMSQGSNVGTVFKLFNIWYNECRFIYYEKRGMLNLNQIAGLTTILFWLTVSITAQERPFPQNIKYPFGVIPKTLNSDWLKSEYDRWKNSALSTCSGGEIYVTTDQGGKVEAVGFGMLIFAYMGDKTKFDGMYNFYKKNCNSGAGGLMGWIGQCGGNSNSSASDGDVDVAFSLIVASWQWPDGGYLEKAKSVITNLKKVVTDCSGVNALQMGMSGGTVYNGCSQVDISYSNPAAFREFAKVIGNAQDSAFWVKTADDVYTILNAGANATTGLVADRQSASGGASGGYGYDACRTPWRICLDYLWNGNEKALAWCKKLSDWAYKTGPANIKDGYSLSGSASGGNHNMAFTGGFAVAAMVNSQAIADEFGAAVKKIRDNGGSGSWFTFSLGPCYLITLTGNQWRNDLKEKQDTGKSAVKNNNPGASGCRPQWRLLGNSELSISGLQPGYSVTLTDLSGKLLCRTTASGEKALLSVSAMKNGCAVLTVRDGSGRIRKTGLVSPL
jgi:endoglucanase